MIAARRNQNILIVMAGRQFSIPPEIERAAVAIREAEALLITAGPGMGVDSGLPDFRGTEGFWKA
jgi:hypothetical protein